VSLGVKRKEKNKNHKKFIIITIIIIIIIIITNRDHWFDTPVQKKSCLQKDAAGKKNCLHRQLQKNNGPPLMLKLFERNNIKC